MKIKFLLKLVIGALLLAFLFSFINIHQVIENIFTLGFLAPAIIVAYFLTQIFFSSLNIKIITYSLGYKVSFKYLLKKYFYVWSLGKLLPGGIGELSIAYFLKKRGVAVNDAVFTAIIDKFLTILLYSMISAVGVWYFLEKDIAAKITFLSLAVVLILPTLIFLPGLKQLVRKSLGKYVKTTKGFVVNLRKLIIQKPLLLLSNFVVTIIKALFSALTVFVLLWMLGINVNLFYILTISVITNYVALIPISISGLGVKEASAVYFFGLIGVDAAIILAIYLLIRTVSLLLSIQILSFTILRRLKVFHKVFNVKL